jgi:hypothetical protein
MSSENVNNLKNRRTGYFIALHLDKNEFSGKVRIRLEPFDFEDDRKFVKLLDDLRDLFFIRDDTDCDAGDFPVLCGSDREILNIESAACKEVRDTCKNTGMVLDKNG